MYRLNQYDRKSAVKYALEYSLNKNSQYHDYTNEGGNCTNYTSQCIFAGAPIMNYSTNGWFYLSEKKTSPSWANVEPFFNFATSNKGEGIYATKSTLVACEIGDIIQLKFKDKLRYTHSLIITEKRGNNPQDIFVCANSRDVKNVTLATYSYEQIRPLHILGYRTTRKE